MNRIIICEDNLYGLMNELGQVIVPVLYEDIRGFSNGFAAVCQDGKWGYIDEDGNEIIYCTYYDAGNFSVDGVAAVRLTKKYNSWGLIKSNGQLIESENNNKHYFIDDFNAQGYARVRSDKGYHVMDTKGNYVNEEPYYSLEYIPEQNIFLADLPGKSCLINTEGEVIVEPEEDYDEIYYPSNGLCQVVRDGKYGYISEEDGKLVIPLKYQAAYEFSDNGLAYVSCENGLGGYINKNDEFVIEPSFDSGTGFRYGLAAVSKDGEYTYIYKDGNQAINHIFKYAGEFAKCGLAKIELFDGRQGFMRPDSKVQFTMKEGCQVEEFIGDKKITKFQVNGKVALVNSEGNALTGLNFDEIIISPDSHLHPFLLNGLWGYLDEEGNIAIDNIYGEASVFTEHNSALVGAYSPTEDDNMMNLYINTQDEIIDARLMDLFNLSFSDKYSKVYRFKNGAAVAVKKEKTKILNCYGKEIKVQGLDMSVEDGIVIIT